MEDLELIKVRGEDVPVDIGLRDGFPLSNGLQFERGVWVIHRIWIELEEFPFNVSVHSIKFMHFV